LTRFVLDMGMTHVTQNPPTCSSVP